MNDYYFPYHPVYFYISNKRIIYTCVCVCVCVLLHIYLSSLVLISLFNLVFRCMYGCVYINIFIYYI